MLNTVGNCGLISIQSKNYGATTGKLNWSSHEGHACRRNWKVNNESVLLRWFAIGLVVVMYFFTITKLQTTEDWTVICSIFDPNGACAFSKVVQEIIPEVCAMKGWYYGIWPTAVIIITRKPVLILHVRTNPMLMCEDSMIGWPESKHIITSSKVSCE